MKGRGIRLTGSKQRVIKGVGHRAITIASRFLFPRPLGEGTKHPSSAPRHFLPEGNDRANHDRFACDLPSRGAGLLFGVDHQRLAAAFNDLGIHYHFFDALHGRQFEHGLQ